MTTHSVPVLIKGQCRIVAVTMDDDLDDRGRIVGYALLNSAGVRLRQALTLVDAKAWMERFVDEENSASPAERVSPKPKHARR